MSHFLVHLKLSMFTATATRSAPGGQMDLRSYLMLVRYTGNSSGRSARIKELMMRWRTSLEEIHPSALTMMRALRFHGWLSERLKKVAVEVTIMQTAEHGSTRILN
uniref:Uncharacterized protein n=1 Tax=Setaria viridis TaxID=4556 RepID=A0A4U6U9T5_SETVI|nr:hypothetical protein SEVIR_5G046650v2 [Setaria viridis]TKW12600.1 hypothetical protein SEVIR_5G046650v2 [Setaria viridis]